MSDTTVYRIQDSDGRGPWRPGFSHRWVEDREDYSSLPTWFDEFGRVDSRALFGMHVGSGCRTLEQLRKWFSASEYKTLRRLGYHAVRLEAGRILAQSTVQCFFERIKPLNEDVETVALYPDILALDTK